MSALAPRCQTANCTNQSSVLLQSRKTGGELQLCPDCASDYHEQGWEVLDGDIDLRGDDA